MSSVEKQGCWFVVQIPTSDGKRGCLLLATSLHSSPSMSFIQRAMFGPFPLSPSPGRVSFLWPGLLGMAAVGLDEP